MSNTLHKNVILGLRINAAAVLIGRGYQHLFFEVPYGVAGSNSEWMVLVMAGLMIGVGIMALWAEIEQFMMQRALFLGSMLLLMHSLFDMAAKGYQLAQLIEHTAQIFSPYLLMLVGRGIATRTLWRIGAICVALTFVGHGMFAAGIFPVPAHFIFMVQRNLGFTPNHALQLLLIAGILDFIVGVSLQFPKFARYVLYYAVFWGFLTTLARLTSYVPLADNFGIGLHENLYKFVLRIPHFLLPLVLLEKDFLAAFLAKNEQKDSAEPVPEKA